MDVVSRRLELLRLDGLGVNRVEIVKQLSPKYGCAERTIYNDFETRSRWQPSLLGISKAEDVSCKVVNRFEQIYAQASKRVVSSPNPNVQISALQLMSSVNSKLAENAIVPEMLHRLDALEQKVSKKDAADEPSGKKARQKSCKKEM